jgi:nucleoside-diphosphate-sugar epimerase
VKSSVLLLGTGYTGAFTAAALRRDGYAVTSTSRQSRTRDAVRFSLDDLTTWDALPPATACVWLFPAEPLPAVTEFVRRFHSRFLTMVVIGTTSSYVAEGKETHVDETTPLDFGLERVKGEEAMREQGALVLRSAGIYGPGVHALPPRNPLDWLRRGLIRDGGRFVNFIQVEDLAAAIVAALRSSVRGEDFIVSDGQPRRWKEILSWANARGYLSMEALPDGGGEGSKRLETGKLHRLLAPTLTHRNLWKELEFLEKRS